MTAPAYYTNDYFRDYFVKYIVDDGMSITDFPTEDIDARCEAAWDVYTDARLNGAPIFMATEEAIETLLKDIDSPETDAVINIVTDSFGYLLLGDNIRFSAKRWAMAFRANIPDLFENISVRPGEELPLVSRQTMTNRIAKYCKDNGIQ